VASADGTVVRCEYRVEEPVTGCVVRSVSTITSPGRDRLEVCRGALRFHDADEPAECFAGAGLAIAEQFGDWDRSPLTDASPEIITIARRR